MFRLYLTCSSLMALILVIPSSSPAQERQSPVRADGLRTISVVGVAEELMTPDLAELTVGIETRRRTASECLEANARLSTELLDILKKQGIVAKDIQTSRIDLSPTYDRPKSENTPDGPSPKILGYQVSNKVVITIRDIKKVGELLDSVVKAGVNKIEGLSFSVSDTKSVVRDLRKRALADAREKADDVAKAAGMQRGNPISILINDTNDHSGDGGMGSGPSADLQISSLTPIAVGQEILQVSVEVVYELKPAQ